MAIDSGKFEDLEKKYERFQNGPLFGMLFNPEVSFTLPDLASLTPAELEKCQRNLHDWKVAQFKSKIPEAERQILSRPFRVWLPHPIQLPTPAQLKETPLQALRSSVEENRQCLEYDAHAIRQLDEHKAKLDSGEFSGTDTLTLTAIDGVPRSFNVPDHGSYLAEVNEKLLILKEAQSLRHSTVASLEAEISERKKLEPEILDRIKTLVRLVNQAEKLVNDVLASRKRWLDSGMRDVASAKDFERDIARLEVLRERWSNEKGTDSQAFHDFGGSDYFPYPYSKNEDETDLEAKLFAFLS